MLLEVDMEHDPVTDEFNPSAARNVEAVFTDPGPVASGGQSGASLGQSGALWGSETGEKPHSPLKNEDSDAPEKMAGHLGHSDDSQMSDGLRKMHEDHSQETQPAEPNAELSDLQLRAIELTIRGHSDSEISQMICVDRKTLWRWKSRNLNYRQYLNRSRRDRWSMIGLRQQSAVDRAACALDRLLDDPSENTRIRAAQVLVRLFGLTGPRR